MWGLPGSEVPLPRAGPQVCGPTARLGDVVLCAQSMEPGRPTGTTGVGTLHRGGHCPHTSPSEVRTGVGDDNDEDEVLTVPTTLPHFWA